MLFVVWVPLILQLLVPLILIVWLGFGRPSSSSAWVLRAVLTGLYLIAIGIGGLWLIMPWYLPVLFGLLLLLAMVHSFRRVSRMPMTL
jgi:hypothetical protein